jgi:hypothetical protein
MIRACKMRIKTRIVDAESGATVKESPWGENLITDQGLNGLAQSTAVASCKSVPASCFTHCLVGSGTNPNSVASGAITFTQDDGGGSAGGILTASASFFNLTMVGQLFKWGTGSGGVETYITGLFNSQHVTVDTTALVTVPEVGTVWNVAQTALQTYAYTNDSYLTGAGDCKSTVSGNQVTHQRTFRFNQKGSPYTVNEIGYNGPTPGTAIVGRFVLSSSDVVSTSQFYVVIMQLIVAYSPSAPTGVGNVGTNINTAGALMLECIGTVGVTQVNSDGSTGPQFGKLEGNLVALCWFTSTYSQNATPAASGSGLANAGLLLDFQTWAYGGTLGHQTLTSTAYTTTTGQTLYGCGIGPAVNQIIMDVKFTTPQTAPTGSFQPNTVWFAYYTRILTN